MRTPIAQDCSGFLDLCLGAAGALCPQVGTLSVARWSHVAGHTEHMTTALSLEAAVNDVSFLAGPVIVTGLSATVHPSLGLATSTVLIIVGVIVLISDPNSQPPPQPRGPGVLLDRRLLTRSFAPFPAVHLLMGVFFRAVPVCLTALLSTKASGPLLACSLPPVVW